MSLVLTPHNQLKVLHVADTPRSLESKSMCDGAGAMTPGTQAATA